MRGTVLSSRRLFASALLGASLLGIGAPAFAQTRRAARRRSLARHRRCAGLQRRPLQRRGRLVQQGRVAGARAAALAVHGARPRQARPVREGPRGVHEDRQRAARSQRAASFPRRAGHGGRRAQAGGAEDRSPHDQGRGRRYGQRPHGERRRPADLGGAAGRAAADGSWHSHRDGDRHRLQSSARERHAQGCGARRRYGEVGGRSQRARASRRAGGGLAGRREPLSVTADSGAPPSDAGPSGGSNGLRIGSYVGFGVGAVGVALGTVFVLKSSSNRKDADEAADELAASGVQPVQR